MLKAVPPSASLKRAPNNIPRGPPPNVGARQLVASNSNLESCILSRNSSNSAHSLSSHESETTNHSVASGASGRGSELAGEFFQPISRLGSSDAERGRSDSARSTELPTIDSSVYHPSSSSVTLPDVSNSVSIGPDGVALSGPVMMLEAKLAAFEQQHRFMLGSLDREYHARSAARLLHIVYFDRNIMR
jgi:hypothetical protein